uniref:NADH dehydrogenase subunit 6 n=1 Tax=Oberthuerella sharkeyi TaxID=2943459 RepID=A0A9E8K056_9HYME|nr:NADH dehydrogenase subunit 6 [Oberthuerella sharkeyi]
MKIFIYINVIMMFIMTMILFLPLSLKNIHPLVMGWSLLMYSILISLNMNIFNINNLYSFLMYLIMIGGFLILFLYFNSFAINNKIIIKIDWIKMFMFNTFFIVIMMTLFIYNINFFNVILFCINKLYESISFNYSLNLSKMKMYLLYIKLFYLTLFMLFYLLYTLLIITKMIYFNNPKSLRQLI